MNRRSESGAVALQAAFLMAMFVSLSAFVVDQGLLLVARSEAQNAADAAAIAGAYARATVNEEPSQIAIQAINVARANQVWMEEPSIAAADVKVQSCEDPEEWWGTGDECVSATVHRTTARGNPLPTVFANFFGLEAQNVSATATARVAGANVTDCLRPFAIPDKWLEQSDCRGNATGGWSADSTFDTEYCSGPNRGQPLPNPDVYVPPSPSSSGTGFTIADYGTRLVLKSGSLISGSWFGALAVPRSDNGGRASFGSPSYVANIESCNGTFTSFGTRIDTLPGNRTGPTAQGVGTLMDGDPSAYWDAGSKRIRGGCMAAGTCAKSSRLIAVAMIDVNDFANGAGSSRVTVRNLVGFFIEGLDGADLVGYLTYYPGVATKSAPQVPGQSSFLKAAVLAR